MDTIDIAIDGPDGVGIVVSDASGRWTVEAIAQRSREDLLDLARAQRIPVSLPSLSAAHDYVDANEFADLTADDAPRSSWDDGVDSLAFAAAAEAHNARVNAAADEVDHWIKSGGLLDALGVITVYLRLDFLPTDDTGPLDLTNVEAALEARLDEVYAGQDDFPVTPVVTFIDGPDASS